ncbi:MAG: hypothetical protein DRP09_14020 [Candidatus Thorarchaeota archaeon]|nr:MAG: hypothetical protein DRP09_14020 [Candidatus Thorarchaeota archaeon]
MSAGRTALMTQREEMTMNAPSGSSERQMDPRESDLRLRLRTFPRDAYAWYMLGKHLRLMDRHREAEEALRRAVSLNPGPTRFWEELAGALADLGRLDEAYLLADSIRPKSLKVEGDLEKLREIEKTIEETSSPCVSCEHYTYYGCSNGHSCQALIEWRSRAVRSKPASS